MPSDFFASKEMGASFIVFGIAMLFVVLAFVLKPNWKKMAEYPRIEAEVSRVAEHRHKDEDHGRDTYSYSFNVVYEVDGKTYSRAFKSNSEPGKTAVVRYNPEKPKECHLASNPPAGQPGMFIAAGLFLAIALVLFFSALGDIKKKRLKAPPVSHAPPPAQND
jgi:hypothetical protein